MYHDHRIIEDRPDFFVLLALWFAFFWRSIAWLLPAMLVAFVICFVIGFVASMATKMLGGTPEGLQAQIVVLATIFGFIAGVWAQMRAWRGMLGGTYGGLRLVLLREAALES